MANFNRSIRHQILFFFLGLSTVTCSQNHMPLPNLNQTLMGIRNNSTPQGTIPLVTFERQIKQIFSERCSTCHNAQSAIPNWLNYSVAFQKKDLIFKRVIETRTMPPGPLSTSITEDERKLISDWIKDGAPKDDTVIAPAPTQETNPAPIPEVSPTEPQDRQCDPELNYALLSETFHSNLAEVKNLLIQGACVNLTVQDSNDPEWMPFSGYSVLMIAIKNNQIELVRVLMNAGARLNITSLDGNTAVTLGKLNPAIYDLIGAYLPVTYRNTVKRIFELRCISCHNMMDARMNFLNYSSAFRKKEAIVNRVVVQKNMPPNNETGMSASERTQIEVWLKAGAPL